MLGDSKNNDTVNRWHLKTKQEHIIDSRFSKACYVQVQFRTEPDSR